MNTSQCHLQETLRSFVPGATRRCRLPQWLLPICNRQHKVKLCVTLGLISFLDLFFKACGTVVGPTNQRDVVEAGCHAHLSIVKCPIFWWVGHNFLFGFSHILGALSSELWWNCSCARTRHSLCASGGLVFQQGVHNVTCIFSCLPTFTDFSYCNKLRIATGYVLLCVSGPNMDEA